MKRFNQDDDEFREESDRFFNENASRYEELVEEEIAMQEAQIDIAHREIDNRLFRTAVRVCEKSFFWSFYSLGTRLKMITETVKRLRKLEE